MTTPTTNISTNNELRTEITFALNRASVENASGTPDHILANYLTDCLAAFDTAVQARANWRGESVDLPIANDDCDPFTEES